MFCDRKRARKKYECSPGGRWSWAPGWKGCSSWSTGTGTAGQSAGTGTGTGAGAGTGAGKSTFFSQDLILKFAVKFVCKELKVVLKVGCEVGIRNFWTGC